MLSVSQIGVIINSNSWHKRMVERVMGPSYFYGPVSLCKYFWTVVLCVEIYIFWILEMRRRKWSETRALKPRRPSRFHKIHWKYKRHKISDKQWAIIVLAPMVGGLVYGLIFYLHFTLIILGIIGGTLGVYALGAHIHSWYQDLPERPHKHEITYRTPRPKEPNMLAEMLKAWKMRACPIIQFRESKEDFV